MTVFRWIFAALVVGLAFMVAMAGMKPRQPPPTQVQIGKAEKMTVTRTVAAAGKLEPVHKVNVSSNITGVLVDLQVGIGSVVKKGQVVGQIDTSNYRSRVDQQRSASDAAGADVLRAVANLNKLKADAGRMKALAERGAGNAADLAQAEDAVRIAEAELQAFKSRSDVARAAMSEAQFSLSWATLKAPVDGTVLNVNHRVGERVRGSDFAEDVILTLGSMTDMDVRIEVGEHDVVFIKEGQSATIEVDSLPEHPLHGKVIDRGRDAIVKNPGTDNEVTTFPVWVSLDDLPANGTVLSGMSAQVSVATESKADVVAVPIQAVTVRSANAPQPTPSDSPSLKGPTPPPPSMPIGSPKTKLDKVVFVVKDGEVQKRKVTTGITSESHIEIVDGLSAGDEVVVGPYRVLARQLEDKQHVTAAAE
jgi:HlyD family secretion protein